MNLIVGWVVAFFADTDRTFALNSKAKPELRSLLHHDPSTKAK